MLKEKTALITGGSKGIGYGIAKAMLANGMKIAITSRTQKSAEKAASSLGNPNQIIGIEADVRNMKSQQDAVQQIIEKWGQLDVLIANAGVGHFADIDDLTVDQWNEVIDVNLTGVFYSTKAGMPFLKKSQGYLITIASLAGTNFFAKGAAYNASKFGLVGFTQAVMLDVRQAGVKVSTIMPGSVSTHFNNRIPSDADAWKIQPDDVGQIVMDLLKMPARDLTLESGSTTEHASVKVAVGFSRLDYLKKIVRLKPNLQNEKNNTITFPHLFRLQLTYLQGVMYFEKTSPHILTSILEKIIF